MAHLHFRQTVYKSGGTAATGRVAYITRQPVHDLSRGEQQLRYIQEGREDLVYTQSRNLPPWADTPHTYFQAAERYEGKNRVAFTELKISLPREMNHREQMDLTRSLVDAIAGDRLPVVYALHDPVALDGGQQPHLHVLISARRTDEHSRTPDQHFKRFNRAEPWRGGTEKDPASWHLGAVKAARVMVVDILNLHLEHGGYEARLHPDSLQARGIDREPEPKLLPSDSNALRHRYEVTPAMQKVFDHRYAREQSAPAEMANAQQYWQERKQQLGISHDMPMDQQLQRIREAREQAITQVPERLPAHELTHEARTLERSISGLETYTQRLHNEHSIEMRYREDFQRPESGKRSAERLLAQGKDHGLPRDVEAERAVATFARTLEQLSYEQEPQAGAALNVRLFREEERDQGMGF